MLKLSYRLADLVVAVSEGQAMWLAATGCVPASKLVVIRSSRNLVSLHDIALAGRSREPLRLATYGRYCEQKGFEIAIEAMRRLPTGTATLTMAGYGPLEQKLRTACASVPDMQVLGPIGNLRDFLASHHAVVVPSRWEAFGIVALEAKSAGRPVIVSGIDGLIEQVDPTFGITIAPESPDELMRAILALAERDLEAMGRAARLSVIDQFDVHIDRWRHLISGIGDPQQVISDLSGGTSRQANRVQRFVNLDAA